MIQILTVISLDSHLYLGNVTPSILTVLNAVHKHKTVWNPIQKLLLNMLVLITMFMRVFLAFNFISEQPPISKLQVAERLSLSLHELCMSLNCNTDTFSNDYPVLWFSRFSASVLTPGCCIPYLRERHR